MANPDLDQIDRDAFDELARERDRQREPRDRRAAPPRGPDAAAPSARRSHFSTEPRVYQATHARLLDLANHAFTDEATRPGSDSEASIVRLACPSCSNPVFVASPARDGDRINCRYCDAPLAVLNASTGVAVERVQLKRGAP